MALKKELRIAYGIAIVLLVVGVISYAAFPAKAPDRPVRLIFNSVAGKVLFDHKTHTADSGYGISCNDCHHNLEEDATNPESCSVCHEPEGTDPLKRSDAFHTQCIGCHQEFGAGPEECAACHVI